MEIFFPHDQVLDGKFPQYIPLFSTPLPDQKILLKTPVHFPITITICKKIPQTKKIPLKTSVHFLVTITICTHRSKIVTCSPSNGDCGGVGRPQIHSYWVFRLWWIKWLSQNFDPVTLGKNDRGRGPRCPLISHHPWKKTTNKHASVICLLAQNAKFHIFIDWGLKLLRQGSLIRWIWWCDFRLDRMTFKGCFPLFSKMRQIFSGS